MMRFLLVRLVRLIPAIWGIISVIFLLSRMLPTDQLLAQVAGSEVDFGGRTITAAERRAAEQQVRHRLGLDEPVFYLSFHRSATATSGSWRWNGLHNQYHHWLRAVLRGELGRSYHDNRPVTALLGEALSCTLPLTITAAFVAVGVALRLAVWLAEHPRWRPLVLAALYGLDALPLFVVALALLLLLANPDVFSLFPAYGFGQGYSAATPFAALSAYLYHLFLPVTSLVLVTLPSLIAQLDTALQRELRADYAVTARAKGLALRQVIRQHTLRNALLPTITLLTDLLPALVAGAVVVEVIFALPGMGRLLAEAAASRDYPVLLGGVLLIASVRLLSHVLADWLYFQADPRIRPQL